MERLQKVMAAAGIGSRRACEQMIARGRVQVDGRTVTELGTKVDPQRAQIVVDGKPIDLPRRHQYIKLHKPRGVLSDIGGDTRGRATVADLLADDVGRVFSVGRLDMNSEGLVLLTDDGELANRLTHPRYQHPKTYFVLIERMPTFNQLELLRTGVKLPDGYRTAPAQVDLVEKLPSDLLLGSGRTAGVWLRLVLNEGKKRQIRHMTAAVGHPTLRLVRWAIGPLTLAKLAHRASQPLSPQEVSALMQLVSTLPQEARAEGTVQDAEQVKKPWSRSRRQKQRSTPPSRSPRSKRRR